jgi:ankyrin repeat protein
MFDYNTYLKAMHELDVQSRNVRFIQACIGGELKKVQLLLDNKDLNVDIYFKDKQGNDGFRWACIFEKHDIVKELLSKYDYKLTKRNLNYIVKSSEHKPCFSDYLKMIEAVELSSSLNKFLPKNSIKNKKSKI